MTLQTHAYIKDSFKVEVIPMELNLTKYEVFLDMVSNSSLQQPLRNYCLASFNIASLKNINNYLKRH